MNEIIESLGDQNEEIDDNELADIEEEIDSINDEEYFKLAKIAIKKGKPQILDYLVNIYNFNKNEITELCMEIVKYGKKQKQEAEDTSDEDDIEEIMIEYSDIIKNCGKSYKKDTHKGSKKGSKIF